MQAPETGEGIDEKNSTRLNDRHTGIDSVHPGKASRMVNFDKLRTKVTKPREINPIEIFRRLPKPPGINDLYTSQAEVLTAWHKARTQSDSILKLHTGGGKTLVGLLIAQSCLNELQDPVLYLVPTVQLVNQTLKKARSYGIPAVVYEKKKPLDESFINGHSIMIATYKALFNGKSKFGVRGGGQPQKCSTVILDDAHVAFSVVRDSFTLTLSSDEEREWYKELTDLFRSAFRDSGRLGTFDDVVSGNEYAVLEVPYWAWHRKLDAVTTVLRQASDDHALVWPLLRDNLHLCHALISKDAFTVTTLLPLVNMFPTFAEAPRRIYMSATIADDSEIIRTFDANPSAFASPFTSRSLAGVSERMILIPHLMPFQMDPIKATKDLVQMVARKELGSVVLVPSDHATKDWSDVAKVATGSTEAEQLIGDLQARRTSGPAVFAGRYDGIDLPNDACRLLVMSGLPAGTSAYELFRASALYGGTTLTRMLAQRVEQGIGRGARGAGDFCVIVLLGADLAAWISKEANFRFLTSATKAQLEMGAEVSKEVEDLKDLVATVRRCLSRDSAWTQYYAETLAERVGEETRDDARLDHVTSERKAFDLWQSGYPEKAIARLEKQISKESQDTQGAGWLLQLAARIADHWGNADRAEELQRHAHSKNPNLLKPKTPRPYRALPVPGEQARAIVDQVVEFRNRRGFLHEFDEVVAALNPNASANQFEQSLLRFGTMIGLTAERHDQNGEGPDVLWLLPNKTGMVIEAKSRKTEGKPLTKEQHGQLLVAAEWFRRNYPGWEYLRVSVHPSAKATVAADAGGSLALTYKRLSEFVSNARELLRELCESQLSRSELESLCAQLLLKSAVSADQIEEAYLVAFEQ